MWRKARERAFHLLRFWGIRLLRSEMTCNIVSSCSPWEVEYTTTNVYHTQWLLIIYCLAVSIYPLLQRQHGTLDIFHDGFCGRRRSPLQRARNYRNDSLFRQLRPFSVYSAPFPPIALKTNSKTAAVLFLKKSFRPFKISGKLTKI